MTATSSPGGWSPGDADLRGSHLLITGPGGGGRRFAEFLLGSTTADPLTVESGNDSITYRNSRGIVVDGVSPREWTSWDTSEGAAVLVAGADSVDDLPEVHDLRRTAIGLSTMHRLGEWCDMPGALLDRVVSAAAPATAVFDGFDHATHAGITDAAKFIRGTAAFHRGLRTLLALRDEVLVDLLRVAALLEPHAFQVGDEWAALSTSVSGRVATVGDVNRALAMFPALWLVDETKGDIQPASPFVSIMLTGLVVPSTSEFYGLYRYFTGRAREMLYRDDVSDDFVSSQLPRMAVRGGAVEEFLSDGPALLVSDVEAIVTELEQNETLMVRPAAKAVLLSAHYRISTGQLGPSQTELALRRLALDTQADEIAALLPDRPWIPIWATSNPVNVHRVLVDRGSSVLGLAAATRGGQHGVVSGHADGSLTWTTFAGRSETLPTDATQHAELRAIAAGSVADRWLIGTAGSDNAVRVIDLETGALLWSDTTTHRGPLSACAAGHDASGRLVLLTAGVGGELHVNDAETGTPVLPAIVRGIEYRGLAVANLDGVAVAVYCAVDGVVGVVDLATGEEKAAINVGEGCNTLAASALGASLTIVAGTSNGKIFRLTLEPETWSMTLEDISPDGIPAVEINAAVISHSLSGTRVEVARSDGVILVISLDGNRPKPLSAHVGPVNALIPISPGAFGSDDELVLVSGGGDGSVRLWRHVATRVEALTKLRINRHRGPVSKVLLSPADHDDLQIITGGYDGSLRSWARSTGDRSTIGMTADGKITSIVDIGEGSERLLLVGADDGSIRELDPGDPSAEVLLLGMAHEGVTAMVGSAQDKLFWSGGRDGEISLWDLRTRTSEIRTDACSVGGVTALALLDAGLVAGGQDGSLTLLGRRDLGVIRRVDLGPGIRALTNVPGSPDTLVVSNAKGEIIITSTFGTSRDPDIRITGAHQGEIPAVAVFQMAGQRFIASAGRDRKLHIWNYASRALLQTIDLEGLPTSVMVHVPYLALSTTSGVAVFALGENQDAPSP